MKVTILIFSFLILWTKVRASVHKIKIGHLHSRHHGVKGTVYVLNEQQLLIQDFNFHGRGEIEFYVCTKTSTPSLSGGVRLDNVHNDGTMENVVQEVLLQLPPDIMSHQIKWLAVISQSVIAGEIIFPETDVPSAHSSVQATTLQKSSLLFASCLIVMANL